MISRISSFSGPLAKLFKVPYVTGFTTVGLILRYEMGLTSSYVGSGTNVVDLVGNSNATLVNAPTYSTNGYLTFDGFNEYLMTNTSLNSKLSPVNTSNIISFFVWAYPIDNGVIVTEQGVGGSINTAWHDSQLEMVNGLIRFGVWNGAGSTSVSSSISTPFNNWYYLGLTYDGTTLRGYVNGQLAASVNTTRSAPYSAGSGLFYAIAANDATSLGDGTYANMKFGAFHVYNTALTDRQISNNYNATKSDYIVTSNLLFWIDANDGISFSGGSIKDLSGNYFTHSLSSGATSSSIFGVKCFDCSTGDKVLLVNSTGPTLSNSGYTYVSWARIISNNTSFRTLYRTTPNDHPLLIDISTDTLGSYDNDTSTLFSSSYSITSVEEQWAQWSVVGDANVSDFYINDTYVGSSSRGASGNKHNWIGNISGQPFGYIANTMMYNTKLTADQIKQNYDALKDIYPNFITTNLKLCLSPDNGTTTAWTDLQGNVSTTMTGTPTYTKGVGYTFNGTNQYGRIPSSAGITDFTNVDSYTVEVWFKPSSGQPNAGTTILEKWNLGNIGRYPYVFRYTESTNNVYIAVYDGSNNPLASSNGFSVNTWHQVVGVFNFTTDVMSIYKNGNLSATTSLVGVNQVSNTSPVGIAHRVSIDGSSAEFMFKGSIGIIRIYNSALSASDISKNFEANRGIYGI